MNLNDYMTAGISSIATTALRFSMRNRKEFSFISHLNPILRQAAKKREIQAADGLHIPPFLIASIAAECNLHCAGCYARVGGACSDEARQDGLLLYQWERIIHEASDLGVSFILLAGGEPLMRRDLLELSAKFKDIVFPVFTNGTLIDNSYLHFFDQNRNVIPIVSIEGDQADTDARRGTGIADIILNNTNQLAKKGILYGVSITVTTKNLDKVTAPAFVTELKQRGCGIIVYVDYVPVEPGSEYLALSQSDCDVREGKVRDLKKRFKSMILISFPGDEKQMGGCLAAGRGFFHISAVGDAEPCPFSPYSDINLKDHTLVDALRSPLFQKLSSEGILSQEHTGGCVLFENENKVKEITKTL